MTAYLVKKKVLERTNSNRSRLDSLWKALGLLRSQVVSILHNAADGVPLQLTNRIAVTSIPP
jgi:hypothetical protein